MAIKKEAGNNEAFEISYTVSDIDNEELLYCLNRAKDEVINTIALRMVKRMMITPGREKDP